MFGAATSKENALPAKLISVIGPPAVGKTTLAELLAKELPATLVLEDYAGNPFLADSYMGGDESRLPAQIHYLLSRVHQLSAACWPGEGLVVSDYGFCQDGLYARTRLSAGDFGIYEQIAARLAAAVHSPDMVICLDASVPLLLERLAARGRGFEKAMDAEFISTMRRGYDEIVQAAQCPVVPVDCDEVDIRQAAWREGLVDRIRAGL